MYTFKTITVEDWKRAVEYEASERAKKMRHKKLALKALREVAPYFFPKNSGFSIKCSIPEGGTYTGWDIRSSIRRGFFHVCISEAKIWVIEVDGDGEKEYPCGKPDWSLDTNLKTA